MSFLSKVYKVYKYDNPYFKRINKIFLEYNGASLDEIQSYQVDKLKSLLIESFKYVPYYHKLFDECGFNPERFSNLDDLCKIPILTKKDINTNRNDLISKNYQNKKLVEISTGGTTGTPMVLYFSKQSKYVRIGNWTKWKKVSGVDFKNDRYCYIGKILNSDFPIKKDQLNDIILFASNKMTEPNILKLIEELKIFKPVYIQGYASALYILATGIKKLNIDVSQLRLKAILTSSDTLFPTYRDTIEKVFNCKVFDHYGQNEDCIVGTECELHNGYHIHEETTYAEVIDLISNRPSDAIGKIVGTNLWNYAMPLIRYEIGDVGRLVSESCECGSKHRRILDFQGRLDDIIKLPDGTPISAGSLNQPMKKSVQEIIEIQYIQKSINSLDINIVPDVHFSQKTIEKFSRELENLIGNNLEIQFKIVDSIPREKNGKYRFIKSEL
ncbi:phenylacetate--CoA ligase family protein [Ruminiclostridium cellobioparum]|uniref:Coenzyme F390 synthetase n=1 Tax=Ruminiclostridium cellobioparum subsp. termitidis CT1112 TaxID=1195236 RepID=S0FJC4_RUMCE|nr:phenylacetate--CoA ligase family protein [Ruminiclostridium cellobioparum]EMS70341.1 Coenzyme F390 synthetase [Ruminiclostridium cellobioparum subsp. termitidis CT1112]